MAWFSIGLPTKPKGSLGRTAQDGHFYSYTAPELCPPPTHPHGPSPSLINILASVAVKQNVFTLLTPTAESMLGTGSLPGRPPTLSFKQFVYSRQTKDTVNYCVLINELLELMGDELIQLGGGGGGECTANQYFT